MTLRIFSIVCSTPHTLIPGVHLNNLTALLCFVQLIQTVTAVDPDEPTGGQHFYYSLAPAGATNPNFTLRDNQGEKEHH